MGEVLLTASIFEVLSQLLLSVVTWYPALSDQGCELKP